MHKRIILVGPAAAGKDYLKSTFKKRGFKLDVSYTTRPIRDGETDGVDYNFLTFDEFNFKIKQSELYEHAKHGEHYYGTGKFEWETCDIFIMETVGVASINPEDRESCFVIYLNPSVEIRTERIQAERNWNQEEIRARLFVDKYKFKYFKDYDMIITEPF